MLGVSQEVKENLYRRGMIHYDKEQSVDGDHPVLFGNYYEDKGETEKKEGSKSFSIVLLFEKILFYMEMLSQFCPIFHFQKLHFFKF